MRPGDPDPQAGFTLLNELSESEIAWLLSEGETRFCDRELVLVKEGARIDFLYLVMEGVFSVTVGAAGAREIAKLGPGQIVGEMSFLEDRPASATVTALEGSQVLCISRAKLEAKMRQDTAFSAHLHRALAIVTSRRLRDAVGQLGRWLETEPMAEPEVLVRWERVARLTQEFKERLLAAGKAAEENEAYDSEDLQGALRTFSGAVNEAIGDESPETIDGREELGARIQRELLAYLLKARTPTQIFQKPRGYPGDFRALEMIADGKPDGTNRLGKMLDAAFLELPCMAALRAAGSIIEEEFRERFGSNERPVRVAAISAAPATELRRLVRDDGKQPGDQATVIEFDDEALLRLRARPPIEGPIRLEMETLVDLALGRHRVRLEPHDFVYALTLGNALSDRFFVGLLNYMYDLLAPGGWAVVGSFHPNNPDKSFLHHILDWPIYHRSEGEVNTLLRHSRFASASENIRFESQGLYFIASCEKA